MFAGSADSVSAKKRVAMKTSPKIQEVITVECVSLDGLSEMKMEDPFLYYSIPGLLHAEMLGEGIDITRVDAQSRPVTQRNCISFECHPDLLLEEDGLLEQDPEDDSNDCEDPLDILIGKLLSR